MEISRANTEAIYGGHISGRRLRGVKVNPIFQENEGSRSGDACDTQSESGVPVGEIQIEMYESLPRHHVQVRHCSSAPIGSQTNTVGSGTLLQERGKDQRDSSGNKKNGRKTPLSVHKKQLSRQKKYDLEFDDPDVIQLADTSLPASGNSSPSSSFYSSQKSNKDTDGSRGSRPYLHKYYMSTLSEKTGSFESSVGHLSRTASDEDGNEMVTTDQSKTTNSRYFVHNNNQSQIHRQETIGQTSINSLDLMNNNEMSMPDQMLQHYDLTEAVRMSRLRAEVLRSDSYVEEFSKSPNTLRAEDFILCDTLSLRALFSLSNSSSIESEYKALESKLANRIQCDCKGLPTLKCKCGRAALQKLFREKRDGFQSGPSEDKLQALDAAQLMKNKVYLGDTESSQIVKSVPRNKLLALHALGHAEGKFVSFSEDTVFNEDNRVTYVKECIPRSAFHLCMDDGEGGYENLGFDGFLTDDEKKALQMDGHDLGDVVHSHGSVVLSVSDLNAPAYLHAYLMGFQKERKGQNSTSSLETRAGPVSIEEIGGITSDDPAFDVIGEATEEEFEYYRRRRRRKKKSGCSEDGSVEAWTKSNSRCRKIKISVVVISVIAGIAAAIGLAVHFGAPALGTTASSSDHTQDSSGGFPHILF